ncbi:MAG: hypothetical protein JOY61_06685 [Chloroflexi bacterium]|nr:hypothetical protein [Chloroflexota bacterium]
MTNADSDVTNADRDATNAENDVTNAENDARRDRRRSDPTAQLTPNRGGDFVEGDMSLTDTLPNPATYQGNHGNTGNGGDDERADADDAKVTGQSRD